MGMMIDEAIRRIDEHNYIHQRKEPRAVDITEAFDTLVEVAMKYQKIEQIYQKWNEVNDFTYNLAMQKISEVIEDGND